MKQQKANIMVAFPAYDEERYIGTLVLKALQYADDVIVVDDGSQDDTTLVAELAGARVFRHEKNSGKGAAVQTILTEAKRQAADVLVILDADSQHNPDEIPNLVRPVLEEGRDLVIGTRKDVRKSIPFYRRVGQGILLQSTRILTESRISDSESGFRALSRKAVETLHLKQNGFAIESEMIAAGAAAGLEVAEVPITVRYLGDGSTLNPIQHGVQVLAQILFMISERKPLFFFGILGAALLVVGLIAGGRTLSAFGASHILPIGTVMLSVLFLTLGVFSVFTGIILHAFSHRR